MKQYHLLIVDDEQRFANMLAKRLRLRGFEVWDTADGEEAVRRLVLRGNQLSDTSFPSIQHPLRLNMCHLANLSVSERFKIDAVF